MPQPIMRGSMMKKSLWRTKENLIWLFAYGYGFKDELFLVELFMLLYGGQYLNNLGLR
jgi:hypothetical protein